MAKKKSGISTRAAKKTYSEVNVHLYYLDNLIPELQADVEALNQNYWYGGKKANEWYESMDTVFAQLIKFDNGVTQLQEELSKVFKRSAGLAGIEF